MIAAMLYLLLTAVPLPLAWSHAFGGIRWEQNLDAAAAIDEARTLGFADAARPAFALTRNRAGTLRFLELVIAAFGATLLSSTFRSPWRLRYLRFAALLGAAVAAGGHIGQWYVPQGDTLWWYLPIAAARPGPVGCFVNRNHFGGFLALLAPVALTLFVDDLRGRRKLWAALAATCFGVMAAATVLSLSRGAVLVFGVATLATGCLLQFRGARGPGRAVAGTVLVLGLLVAAIPNPAVRSRLQSLAHPLATASAHTRLSNWRECLRVWPHYPLLGAGANALRIVFPQSRRTSSGGWLVHAENEYIELWVEGGLVGSALAGTLLILAVQRMRRSGASSALPMVLSVGVPAAVIAAAAHACLDFPLHVPLYAVTLGSLLGLRLAPAETATASGAPQGAQRMAAAAAPAVVGLALIAVLANSVYGAMYRLDSYEFAPLAGPGSLTRAVQWAPTSWQAWYYLGRVATAASTADRDPNLYSYGVRCVTRAAEYDPQNYRLWYQLGMLRRSLGDHAGAGEAFARATRLRPWLHPPEEAGH